MLRVDDGPVCVLREINATLTRALERLLTVYLPLAVRLADMAI